MHMYKQITCMLKLNAHHKGSIASNRNIDTSIESQKSRWNEIAAIRCHSRQKEHHELEQGKSQVVTWRMYKTSTASERLPQESFERWLPRALCDEWFVDGVHQTKGGLTKAPTIMLQVNKMPQVWKNCHPPELPYVRHTTSGPACMKADQPTEGTATFL